VIADPPVFDGLAHVKETCWFPATPDRLVGDPGGPARGETGLLAEL
jgi:hypothetical protein